MYFSNLPKIVYAFEINGELVLRFMQDVTANVRPIKEILENIMYYDDFDIDELDTPEIIAEKIYGDPLLHWIILLVNEKYHYLDDFPIPEYRFDEYVTAKYGAGNEYSTHQIYGRDHYVSPTGRIVDSTYPLSVPVSNIDYEREINQAKRRIRVVNPQLLSTFIKDLQEAFARE